MRFLVRIAMIWFAFRFFDACVPQLSPFSSGFSGPSTALGLAGEALFQRLEPLEVLNESF